MSAPTNWKCSVCGYVHEGDAPPETCPVCGAGAEHFVRLGEDAAPAAAPVSKPDGDWHKVAEAGDLPEGRVRTVTAAGRSFALTHFEGKHACLDNRCPHEGGPLGEGTIENGLLRCPWHGWDFHPLTGESPAGFGDQVPSCACEAREDGVYVEAAAPEPPPRTASDVLAETMVAWGVTHVFGMVGHSNLGFADAVRRLEEAGKLTYIGIRHEGAASFAASAFAKLTGRPAACLSIAGPGATNLLTGLWDAKVDRAPILALTGQVNAQVLGTGAFQELDLRAAFQSVAAWSQTVLPSSRFSELMALALKTALIERDVAHLVLPDEVQVKPVPSAAGPGPEGRVAPPEITPPRASLEQALARIREAKRPVVLAGHGARFHMDDVVALAERLSCPVVTTFKAKGQISDHHPLACGVMGRSGTPVASHFVNEYDLLVVLGGGFARHTGVPQSIPAIQVDFDRTALGKFHPVAVPVWGEIGTTARWLHDALADDPPRPDHRPEIAERWAGWRAEKASRMDDDFGRGLSAAALFDAMSRLVPADAVITVDVGNNTYSFGRYFECQRQSVLMSGYLGSIGFGYPAALGAWAAAPDRPIVTVTGDGGFGQYMAELTTAVKYGMNITHVLLNNNELGKISKEQRAASLPVWSTALVNPDFAGYANGCGALGLKVTGRGQLDEALQRALAHDGPALVEVTIDPALV